MPAYRSFRRSQTSRSLPFSASPGGSRPHSSRNHSHRSSGRDVDIEIPPNHPTFEVEAELGPTLAHLPFNTSQEVDDLIYHAWDSSTSSRYNGHVLDFTRFCIGRGITRASMFPASEELLCSYVSSMAGKYAGRTIGSKLAGIRAWHIRNNLPWNRGSRLSYALKGAEKLRPPSSYQPQRPPVTTAMLNALRNGLDFTDNKDICVWAIATVTFWAQLRLGEILPHAASNFKVENFPTWNGLGEPTDFGSRMLHLPHTKCGGARGKQVVVARQEVDYDPISALKAHHLSSTPMENDLIASYLLPNGNRSILTSRAFLSRINFIMKDAGLPSVSGHCFRIGGTTELLLIGIPPHIVKALGRWKSDVFMRYWRSLEILGPRYIEHRPPDSSNSR